MQEEIKGDDSTTKKNYWDEADAQKHGDVALKRCIHDKPLNVFCGKCEA